MNCPKCDMPLPNHTYEGLFDCLIKLGKTNKILLDICERAAKGHRNLVEFGVLPHSGWDEEAIREATYIENVICMVKSNTVLEEIEK